jgi:hypothetical protein
VIDVDIDDTLTLRFFYSLNLNFDPSSASEVELLFICRDELGFIHYEMISKSCFKLTQVHQIT